MKQDFTLEDILEEQRLERERNRASGEAAPAAGPEYVEEAQPPAGPQDAPEYAGAPAYEAPPPYQEEPAPPEPPEPEPEEESKGKKKKKKRRGLFGWRKKVPDFDENEEIGRAHV